MSEYDDARRIVLAVRIKREESGRTCAAMLSEISEAERLGEPCPGYVELLDRVKAEA